MATKRAREMDPSERIDSALSAAAEASERFVEAKTQLLHRLADIDGALIEIVQRVYDSTPPEFQRAYLVHMDGDDDELSLPDFLRVLLERASGTRGTFTISVPENLYDDGDEDEDAEDGEDEDRGDEEDDAEEEADAEEEKPARKGRAKPAPAVDEEDDDLGF